ncbi:Carbohydrate sulfotransferase 11 [Porphyridium purpureum]|uniref:Carbohydrate sulfotransferase 11 n=1 Tax=Porphyridium purpureum TaxID=35688 RepID=A0A5J4YVC6_PORPP|nr:Carbohydrate sulfotransferase 11 [Porphyridium purpureum]|eukprot:POR7944..scf227_4
MRQYHSDKLRCVYRLDVDRLSSPGLLEVLNANMQPSLPPGAPKYEPTSTLNRAHYSSPRWRSRPVMLFGLFLVCAASFVALSLRSAQFADVSLKVTQNDASSTGRSIENNARGAPVSRIESSGSIAASSFSTTTASAATTYPFTSSSTTNARGHGAFDDESREKAAPRDETRAQAAHSERFTRRSGFDGRRRSQGDAEIFRVDRLAPVQNRFPGHSCLGNMLQMKRSEPPVAVDSNFSRNEANFLGALVLPDFRIVMCSIPKNACSRLRALAVRLMSESQRMEQGAENGQVIYKNPTPKEIKYFIENSLNKQILQELRLLKPRERQSIINDPSWFKVAVVRNPYTRVLSAYLEKILQGKFHFQNAKDVKSIDDWTFEKYVEALITYPNVLNEHFREQATMCAFRYIEYDVIAKIETLRHDLECIGNVSGFGHAVRSGWARNLKSGDSAFDFTTGHESKARTKMTDYYTPELQRKIYERFRVDFEAFDYPYELP